MDYRSSLSNFRQKLSDRLFDYRSVLQAYIPVLTTKTAAVGAGAVLTFMMFPENFLSVGKAAFADSIVHFGSMLYPDKEIYQGWDCMSVHLEGAPNHEYIVGLTEQSGTDVWGRYVKTNESGIFEEIDMFCFDPNKDAAGEYTLYSRDGGIGDDERLFYNDGEF